MNVLLLVVALSAPVEAPKTGLQEATAAIAAVAPDEVVPEAHGSPLATANAPTLREAPACVAAECGGCQVGEARPGEPCALRASVSLEAVNDAPVAEPRRLATLPEARADTECDLLSLFAEKRFLSAPWSAARRLAAAKLRKDAEEERRMKAKVGESVEEALGVEVEGTDDD